MYGIEVRVHGRHELGQRQTLELRHGVGALVQLGAQTRPGEGGR